MIDNQHVAEIFKYAVLTEQASDAKKLGNNIGNFMKFAAKDEERDQKKLEE